MTYSQRYCAFIDVLGFRSILRESGSDTNAVRDLLKVVHEPQPLGLTGTANVNLRSQSISDAVCLTTDPTLEGLDHLFANIEVLALQLLAKGRFLRGAIVKDGLYEEDGMVFGPALIRAYKLESTVALVPRVIVEKTVRDETEQPAARERLRPLHQRLRQSDDGPYFLHVLWSLDHLRPTNTADLDHANSFAEKIQMRLDETVDTPDIFKKVHWFAEYWNSVAITYPEGSLRKITGPNLHTYLAV